MASREARGKESLECCDHLRGELGGWEDARLLHPHAATGSLCYGRLHEGATFLQHGATQIWRLFRETSVAPLLAAPPEDL